MSRPNLSWQHLSISGIPQLLLTGSLRNIKGKFLGPSLTDANCHGDICPGNICPGNICPYQEYLNCNCFGPNKFFEPKNFSYKMFWTKNFLAPKFFGPNSFWTKNYYDLKFLGPKICRQRFLKSFDPNIFGPRIFFTPNLFLKAQIKKDPSRSLKNLVLCQSKP